MSKTKRLDKQKLIELLEKPENWKPDIIKLLAETGGSYKSVYDFVQRWSNYAQIENITIKYTDIKKVLANHKTKRLENKK